MPRKKTDNKNFQFETSLDELEKLVNSMEKGDLSLEESLQSFEQGIALTRACQKALDEAEQKVSKLTEDGELAPLDTEED